MLSNIDSEDITLELSTPNRAGLLMPAQADENESILMLVIVGVVRCAGQDQLGRFFGITVPLIDACTSMHAAGSVDVSNQ